MGEQSAYIVGLLLSRPEGRYTRLMLRRARLTTASVRNLSWTQVTQVVILNSEPDLANGYLALYAGEKLAIELTDVVFRVNTTVTATAMMFSSQLAFARSTEWRTQLTHSLTTSLLRRFLGRLCGDCRLLVLLSQLSVPLGRRSEFRSRRSSQSELRRLSAFTP
mgnify:FL=1|jgi:hypothetical protein